MSIGTPILKEVHGRSAPSGFAGQVSRTLKRCLDCALAALLLVLLLPIFFILGVLVLLDDGWPIFHKRWVVGQNGEFDAFKFRSMRRNADQILERDPALKAEFEQNFKLRDDPRLTRTGEFLRKHSLDELPQLLNVLAGQMSLVGPRMITAPELEKYGAYQNLLLSVRPGITGYWQVNGRQDVGYEERVAMDIRYIENWSFWLDIKILCLTPLKVIKREGAY
jgi:lipopolysaccharide/colanic/teichoic acid biosynthesis glycosyltransferase